ncbi:MAG: hypothetical protein WKF73_04715 [Nocardioidaceae bacterium]
MNMNDQLARELIRERTSHRFPTQRPSHPAAARALRRLAKRLDSTQ